MPLKICFVASEIAPLAKTGGLADVAGVLPRHLHALGHDVRVFMPLYSSMSNGALRDAPPVTTARDVSLSLGAHRYSFTILESRLPNSSVPLYLVHCPEVYDRPSIYTSEPGRASAFPGLATSDARCLPAHAVRAGHPAL